MRITLPSGRNNEPAFSYRRSDKYLDKSVTITLNHFGAAVVFSVFASIVFGITHRDTTREMIRYGLYCFAMFLGGTIVAGWLMWMLRK